MRDDEDADFWGEAAPILDEDSGSAFELSESEQRISSERKRGLHASNSRRDRNNSSPFERKRRSRASGPRRPRSNISPQSQDVDEQSSEDMRQWAADSQASQSPSDLENPERSSRKRRRVESATEIRAKRVKNHIAEYRDLLNSDIHDAATRILHENKVPLPQSQIGAVIWTSAEKELFFSALSRLGKSDLRGIAERIGTKSEVEVHDYIRLLDEAVIERRDQDTRNFSLGDIPPALEISETCCFLLENAGDGLASRQEQHEEEKEMAKWGDGWLVTEAVSRRLGRLKGDGEGDEAIAEVLPAANLFNLSCWLELSTKIFMNPAAPYEDGNWRNLVQNGERPAVRATAFEDFHSLAVSITKRLISTVLFCTMSRLRATSAKKTKHAHVNPKDVEAALHILGMKTDSQEFWRKCARRCHLRVVDDEWPDEDIYTPMTYDEVEEALEPTQLSRSRSVSQSANHPPQSSSSSSESELLVSDNESLLSDDGDADLAASDLSDSSRTPRIETSPRPELAINAAEHAQDQYLETIDLHVSQAEESRLWELLGEAPPFDIKPEPPDELERLKMSKNRIDDEGDWRQHTEYCSEWELFERPVPEKNFEKAKRKMMRRGERGGTGERVEGDSSDSDIEEIEGTEHDDQSEVEEYEEEYEDENEDEDDIMVENDGIEELQDEVFGPDPTRFLVGDDERTSHLRESPLVSQTLGDGIKIEMED
ncbi:uncharacterized protein BP5553_06348 [Venustampulla echinocandica]|uniref:Myb-like domain-containing protein n=1 Tax=Venustampulla echinocandica TaxID=2656787 RepID=A0A370TJN9_9HELO|nr:uncharacterized protein BP5553_06348 [Venustampulla echinocandica]RDL35736.1 hypothetical protein BP5553_06348 [Venustampulla echinocandica]